MKAADVKKNQAEDELGDAELLRLSDKGDEDAFLVLYDRHQGPVFRFSLHMSGSREMAEEVTQEVFMSLLSERKLYAPGRGPLQAYLIGIARNKLRRQLARDRRCPAGSSVAEERISLLDGLDKERQLAALRKAISSLPPNYREVVVLCDLENKDYEQTARQLGCAVGTVRSRLHRARAILGAKLRKSQGCPV
ncbi:MAG: RNA polymerase sigma factor [Acidobacteriota bacterium]|nr:RNA polymerase sigma factor [Acidobacteriota bacterium]